MDSESKKIKCIDLSALMKRTKSNPKLMMEMISLYLEQTPPLVSLMTQSLDAKDWNSMYKAVHKMIPSFSIMGMSEECENLAKRVLEYTSNKKQIAKIPDLVFQLEKYCEQAHEELKEAFKTFEDSK